MVYYTDGATSNNGYQNSQGGWAWVRVSEAGAEDRHSGAITDTTNNRCELYALIGACTDAASHHYPNVIIYTDSAYCANCFAEKWYEKWQQNGWRNSKRQPVANRDLWEILIPLVLDNQIQIKKVKGHTGHKYNEMADRLAVKAKGDNGLA